MTFLIGADALRDQSEKFGFGTSFSMPMSAATSRFPVDPDDAQTAMSAIGQFDVRATALQMVMVGAAIGNRGITMNPYLVDQELAPDLTVLSQTQPSIFRTAMSDACTLIPSQENPPASMAAGSRQPKSDARFNTITGCDWKRSLVSARQRRASASERIRTMTSFSGNPTK
jgi:hypothetical protein